MRGHKVQTTLKTIKRPIMVMGISACGKTSIGRTLASQIGGLFIEADGLHPASNVEKMKSGMPLTDTDRAPWLDRLIDEVRAVSDGRDQVVFSCSALKADYRRTLRNGCPGLVTIFLEIDASTAMARSSAREGHFMPAALVESQIQTLERPDDEPSTASVDAGASMDEVLVSVRRALDDLLKV